MFIITCTCTKKIKTEVVAKGETRSLALVKFKEYLSNYFIEADNSFVNSVCKELSEQNQYDDVVEYWTLIEV